VRPSLPLLAVLSTALMAAVSAHVGIDVLGDFLVRDDSYDHVAHGSRELFTVFALFLAAGAGCYLLSALCSTAASIRARVRLLQLSRIQLARFGAAVALVALALVPAMETIDAMRAGIDVDSLADAFGSSLLLGTSVTIACAIVWCAVLFGITAWLCKHRESVARIIYEAIAVSSVQPAACKHESRERAGIAVHIRERRALRRSKRGPPAVRIVPVLAFSPQ
jgi:hypothetical protein